MSTELFDYIESIKPTLGDAKRAMIGLLIMHYITMARVSDGGVRIDNVLTASGRPFTQKVLRTMSTVRSLAFALKVDMTCIYDDGRIPQGLKRLCERYHVDVEACIARNKRLEDARGEMWDLVIFVKVALAVMARLTRRLFAASMSLTTDTVQQVTSKSKWLGLGACESTPAVRARDLPRAKVPRAVGLGARAATDSGPISMARNVSEESSALSSGSARAKLNSQKSVSIPRPVPPAAVSQPARRDQPVRTSVPIATPQVQYIAQRAALSAYLRTMEQGTASRRIY